MSKHFKYLPSNERKKILLICDDIRVHSGVATVAKEMVLHTAQHFNWVQIAGGEVFSKDKGMKLDRFNTNWFGKSRVATISKEKTTIVDGGGDEKDINQRVEELSQQIEKAETPFEIERLQDRMAKFVDGVAIVHVGGNTELEMKEKKDRVDDTLHATKAALEEGIVPGGGMALIYSNNSISTLENGNPDYNFGLKIVQQACKKPFETILTNAGKTETEAQILAYEFEGNSNPWAGYNIKTDSYTSMKEAGIIDPVKVTRSALQNAASVADTILLTEAVVVDEPEDKKDEGIDPSMFGM